MTHPRTLPSDDEGSKEQLHGVEMLEEASKAAGWDIEYRQLQAGQLSTHCSARDWQDISVLWEHTNRQLEVVGETPARMVTVFIPNADNRTRINNTEIQSGDLLLFPSHAEVQVVSSSVAEMTTLHISEELLSEYGRTLSPDWQDLKHKSMCLLRLGPDAATTFRRLAHSSLDGPANKASIAELSDELLVNLVSLMSSPNSHGPMKDPYARWEKSTRLLKIARQYIDENLDEPISMADLCHHTCASLSTLERLFRRELQMSPTKYIRTRRLVRVRQMLLDPEHRSKTLTQIALECGFGHLGRFAQDYRKHYGQTPSGARKSAPLLIQT